MFSLISKSFVFCYLNKVFPSILVYMSVPETHFFCTPLTFFFFYVPDRSQFGPAGSAAVGGVRDPQSRRDALVLSIWMPWVIRVDLIYFLKALSFSFSEFLRCYYYKCYCYIGSVYSYSGFSGCCLLVPFCIHGGDILVTVFAESLPRTCQNHDNCHDFQDLLCRYSNIHVLETIFRYNLYIITIFFCSCSGF